MHADYRKYLDPKVLAKIGGLELRARLLVEGYFTGMHRSPYRGASVEFADHRQYVQGDDLRHIDWRVFGRTDKFYLKEYEQETNLTCMIVVDGSESMSYQSEHAPMSKHEYATSLAAALAYLALRQRDSVGLALFSDRVVKFLRPSNHPAQWKTLIHELLTAPGPSKTSVQAVLDDLAERLAQRSLVVIISDMFDDPRRTLKGLRHLQYRRHESIVLNVWDPAELTFPFAGPTRFEGLESQGTLLTDPRWVRTRYLEQVERFIEALRGGCRQMQIDYELFDTSSALDTGISTYLATRSGLIRSGGGGVLRARARG